MRSLEPVVWREGMHLAQHHFQLRDRYFEDSAAFVLSSTVFRPYGLTRLELDHEALINGTVSLVQAAGVMPDGLPFSFPDDPPPASLEIRELFSPTRESHLLLLAIPPFQPGRANCRDGGDAGGSDYRFHAQTLDVVDETTGAEERSVLVARKNFRLTLDLGDLEDHVTLPLARIKRDRSGNFVYDPDYVPPCLQIAASASILERLRRLIEVMEAKTAALITEGKAEASGAEYSPDEITRFWLLHAIQSGVAPLRHLLAARTSHPEQVYFELLRLAGALCTFSMESQPRDLPLYDHDDLESGFHALDRHIRRHLEVVLPQRTLRISLEPTEEFFWRGAVTDARALRDSHWFLEVRVEGSRADAIADVPRLVKICSAKHIVRLVKSAHSGMKLEHVITPPPAISPKLGAEYFRIETETRERNPCWLSIGQSAEVGVYAPEALVDAEMAIVVVRAD